MTNTQTAAAETALIPIAVSTLAIFILTGMDAAMKGLVLAIGVYNTLLWRSLLATAVTGTVWVAGRNAFPSRPVLLLHIQRGLVIAVVATCFFWGLGRLPLAETIAISFIAPLIALYMAAILLGERIGRSAIWASLAGMAGVLIIVAGKVGTMAMTTEVALGVGAVLISAVFYAYNIILARRQAQVAGPLEVAVFQNTTLAVTLACAAPWLGQHLPMEYWMPLVVATALNLSGQLMLTWAFARAEAQYLIPTEYTSFVWAVILGWVVFGEAVGWTTVAGAALIVAGCLYVAFRRPRPAEPIEPAGV